MSKDTPLIIGFVADIMMQARISATAQKLNYAIEWVESAAQFGEAEVRDRPGEPISGGQTGNLTDALSQKQPDLLIFDLTVAEIPAARWIAILKSSPATRRIPVLAFGPHVETALIEKAHKAGADDVVTRGRFVEKLPDLINKNARRVDYAGIMTACAEPLSDLAKQGIALFNQGEYYEAHHGLEDAWNGDKGLARDLYRALLQVAVAYLQIERGNYRGALKMCLRVRQWLDPLPETCRGIDLDQLRADFAAVHAHLTELGADNIAEFDKRLFKPIQIQLDQS